MQKCLTRTKYARGRVICTLRLVRKLQNIQIIPFVWYKSFRTCDLFSSFATKASELAIYTRRLVRKLQNLQIAPIVWCESFRIYELHPSFGAKASEPAICFGILNSKNSKYGNNANGNVK